MSLIRREAFTKVLRPTPAEPTSTKWTDEQEAIFARARSDENLMIEALAGTGKTSTIKEFNRRLAPRFRPNLYLVFNVKNADEARGEMPSTTLVKTFNGIGHQVWFSGGRTANVDKRKAQNIYRDMINEVPATDRGTRAMMWLIYDQVISGVGLAKSLGYIPSGVAKAENSLIGRSRFHSFLDEAPDDLVADLIDAVLRKSITSAFKGHIDYNDQCYMPALFGGIFPKFPLVMVDEYQDLSPVNHALLAKLVRDRRLVGVGDECQSIYGFRGAKAGGMGEAIRTYGMTTFPLSTSFRCPSAIVDHVRWRVPTFRALRKGGVVNLSGHIHASSISPTATFICRNNAPLMAMAFRLLAGGHSVSVSGTDIGPRLISTMDRLGPGTLSQAQTLHAIDTWEAERVDRESKSAPDFAACMRIFARQSDSLDGAVAYAKHLFEQDGSILLTTGHKAKGLEFPDVYHLDPWLCKDLGQDQNLSYVISTRSSDSLTEIDSDGITWE